MSGIDHIFFYIVLYVLFYKYDTYINTYHPKIDSLKKYCIFTFVFIEGLRYGRGRDYFHYGVDYLNCLKNSEGSSVFLYLQQIIFNFDFTKDYMPYGSFFIVLSIVFIVCYFKFGELFKGESVGFYLLGILATQYIFEWTIRQGLSFALILLSFYYIFNSRKYISLIFLLLGLSIHLGNVLFISSLLVAYFLLNKKPIPLKMSLPILLLGSFIADVTKIMPFIQNIVSNLDIGFLGDYYAHYAEENDKWFSAESTMKDMQRSLITTIITTIFYASTIIIGYYNHKEFRKWTFVYNIYVIVLLLYVPFYTIEIISRLLLPTTVLWFIPTSLSLYNIPFKSSPLVLRVSYISLFVYLMAYYGRFVFLNRFGTYVWNPLPMIEYFEL